MNGKAVRAYFIQRHMRSPHHLLRRCSATILCTDVRFTLEWSAGALNALDAAAHCVFQAWMRPPRCRRMLPRRALGLRPCPPQSWDAERPGALAPLERHPPAADRHPADGLGPCSGGVLTAMCAADAGGGARAAGGCGRAGGDAARAAGADRPGAAVVLRHGRPGLGVGRAHGRCVLIQAPPLGCVLASQQHVRWARWVSQWQTPVRLRRSVYEPGSLGNCILWSAAMFCCTQQEPAVHRWRGGWTRGAVQG